MLRPKDLGHRRAKESRDRGADVLPLAQGVWRVGKCGPAGARRLKELEQENAKLKRLVSGVESGEAGAEGHRLGKLLSPERRRKAVSHARQAAWDERAAGVPGGATSHAARNAIGRHSATTKIRSPRPSQRWSSQCGRYGYRRITWRCSSGAGWKVGKDRVESESGVVRG